MSTPKLMKGYRSRQRRYDPNLPKLRWATPLNYARSALEDTARRVAESRKLFGRHFFRGDFHAHSQHSDGIGTVAEMAEMVRVAELDFQYITDHWGLTQARECQREGLWAGQEPGGGLGLHHLGILGLDHAFTPTKDQAADIREIRRRGGTVFIPHPAGWWPRTLYGEEQKKTLYALPDPLLLEVFNGAGHLISAHDKFDEIARDLWDELLMAGRNAVILSGTDAHSPHGVGIVWSGVFAPRCEPHAIEKALTAGRVFASEAPLLDLSAGRIGMGSCVRNRTALLRVKAVDSRGLLQVRLIADGRVRQVWHPDGAVVVERELRIPDRWKRYVRVEATAVDGRRAFSNPLFLAGK